MRPILAIRRRSALPRLLAVSAAAFGILTATSPRPGFAQAAYAVGVRVDFATAATPVAVAIGDVNGDAKPDLVVGIYSGALSVMLGYGAGGFGARTDFATGSTHYSLGLADLNGDGKPDLVAANNADNTVSVLLGDGTG